MAIDRELFIKLVFPSLVGISLLITLIPELRLMGIIFFGIGSIAWFLMFIGKPKFLSSDQDDNRYLKYFFYPTALFNLFLIMISQDYRDSGTGTIYLVLSVITYLLYISFPQITIGIPKKFYKGIFIGLGMFIGFFILNKIAPAFSLLTPQAPFSLGNFFRGFVIIIFAPILEAGSFRGALMKFIMDKYKISFTKANIIQGNIFGGYHFLAYGIALGALKTLTEFFGATIAISGSLITAITYGIVIGYLVYKNNSIMVELASHMPINAGLFFTVLSAGTFFSIG